MFPVVPNSSLNSECPRGYKSKDLKHTSSISHESSVIRQIHFCSSDRVLKVPSPSDSVSAYEFLEKDTLSSGISTAELVTHTSCGRIGIRKSSNGIIKPAQKVTTWIRSIRLSPDVYSHNAIIELNEEKQVRVRVTKNIAPGEEVIAWLSEEISLFMNIPFLTPSNIIDNKCYTCHLCKTSFETPNPLKIHLAIACGQQNIDILWVRLHYGVAKDQDQPPRQSAFKSISESIVSYHLRSTSFPPMVPGGSFTHLPLAQLPQAGPTVNTAAQIETIVSNMGSSKQGHLCIYCGKIYSRKYGLKIHIRTHTGFKPLKCKFCLRPFGDPSNLNKHVRLHMQGGSSIFKCHLCDKVMVRRRDLQRHLQTRHDGETFSGKKDTSSSSEDY